MNKKKIAILTQPLGYNYGGIIQNYALQMVLKNRGFDVETISREYKITKLRLLLSKLKNEVFSRFKEGGKKIFSESEKKYIASEMLRFIDEYINKSKKLYSTEELQKYFENKDFDIVVVGSDQTWRPKYSPNIYNYYLDFLVENKRIKKTAYASSFGTDTWEYSEKESVKCKELVKQFNAISVRESSGVTLCKKELGVKVEWTLDPAMLLDKDHYMSLVQGVEDVNKGGLFNYTLDERADKQMFISEISNELKLNIYKNQPKRSLSKALKSTSITDYKYPSIERWLKSFYNADFIVTDSFHGTIFSIIFNKPFLSIVNKERGASRFYSLLEKFDLQERLIVDYTQFNREIFNKEIDYSSVNKKLNELRSHSFRFIDENMI